MRSLQGGRGPLFLAAALIVAAGIAAFHNSLAGPFVFDDVWGIRDNPTLRQLWPLTDVLKPIPGALTVSGQPILNLSFALNFAFGGTDVSGYHATNLIIHLLAGLLLFGIVRRTLARYLPEKDALLLGATAAALWTVHPLQTESVTYIIQRAESLMGLMFFFTLYAAVRGMESRRPWVWYGPAVAVCALGMGTKEVTALAPLMVLLYDRAFIAGSFGEAWRRRKFLYLALAATWSIQVWLALFLGDRDGSMGFGVAVSPWAYALTQFQAIARYLWLSFWPHPLVFDYGVFQVRGWKDIVPYATLVLPLAAATLWGLVRNRPWAFAGAWFFGILAPTSSIIPSIRQTMCEHRMYLPLAAVLALLVIALYLLLRRRLWPAVAIGAAWTAALCFVTVERNEDYESSFRLYSEAAAVQPDNAYAQFGLGSEWLARNRAEEALKHIDRALALKPDDKSFHLNRADALVKLGRIEEALPEFEAGFRLGSTTPEVLSSYVFALIAAHRAQEAIYHLRTLISLRPQDGHLRRVLAELERMQSEKTD